MATTWAEKVKPQPKEPEAEEESALDWDAIRPNLADHVMHYFGNNHAQNKLAYWDALSDLVDVYRDDTSNINDLINARRNINERLMNVGYEGRHANEVVQLVDAGCRERAERIESKPSRVPIEAEKPSIADWMASWCGNRQAETKINFHEACEGLTKAYKTRNDKYINEKAADVKDALGSMGHSFHHLEAANELVLDSCRTRAQQELSRGNIFGGRGR